MKFKNNLVRFPADGGKEAGKGRRRLIGSLCKVFFLPDFVRRPGKLPLENLTCKRRLISELNAS